MATDVGMTLNPMFSVPTATIATLPSLQLSPEEAQAAQWLATRLFDQRPYLELHDLYYDGLQKMQDLGIAIPPQLSRIRTIVGWPRLGIDALANRCRVEGFRYPGVTDTDEDLWDIWQSNNLDATAHLAHVDSLVFGRCYLVAGTPDPDDSTNGQPLITAESPMNMTALWNPRMRRCTAALQIYLDTDFTSDMYGQEVAALYLPNSTILMGRSATTPGGTAEKWSLVNRDDHGLQRVPVVHMSNRARLQNPDGLSEITPEWMNTTDSACRTLLGMELGREFYSAPRRYILGASEDAFQTADGTATNAWETYMSKVWAIERDEEGNVPSVGEFKANDPTVYTKMIDEYAKIMSGEMGVPPHFLGIFSDGNPASADAIRSGYEELTVRARNKHIQFGDAWEEIMRLALLIRDGVLPPEAHRMESDWTDPMPLTPLSTSQAMFQQTQGGMVPPTADDVLKRLGYSALERERLDIARKKDMGQQFLTELAHSIMGKEARVDTQLSTYMGSGSNVPGMEPVPTGLPGAIPPKVQGAKKTPIQPPRRG